MIHYLKAAERHFINDVAISRHCTIPNDVIRLHKKILIERFNYNSSRILQMDEEIKRIYSTAIPLTESEYEGIDLNDIRKPGVKALKRSVRNIISSCQSNAEARNMIRMFLAK